MVDSLSLQWKGCRQSLPRRNGESTYPFPGTPRPRLRSIVAAPREDECLRHAHGTPPRRPARFLPGSLQANFRREAPIRLIHRRDDDDFASTGGARLFQRLWQTGIGGENANALLVALIREVLAGFRIDDGHACTGIFLLKERATSNPL